MESSTTKIVVNILIVSALMLIGGFLVISFKKTSETKTPTEASQSVKSVVVESASSSIAVNTNVVSTTTEVFDKGFKGRELYIQDKKLILTRTTSEANKITTPPKASLFSITFTKDGSLTGTTDCNSFFGKYTVVDGKLYISPLASSRMFCEGSQEVPFIASLQTAGYYGLSADNKLTLVTSSGTLMFK